jgi:DNA-directed RNA polymerase specialized sigma24 family protein
MATVKPLSVTEEAVEAALIMVRDRLESYWLHRGQWGLAADLAQEGICKGFLSRSSWKQGRGSLEAFLYTVGRNAGRDLLRKEGTQKRGKDSIQQAANRLLCFKMDGVLRRKRRNSDEPGCPPRVNR